MRIGIVGNGNIVRRFLTDMKQVKDTEAAGICVREKSKGKGELLAKEYGIPFVETDYASFLARPDIDAVYLGLINHVHFSYAKQALLAGKSVICEKPIVVHTAQMQELIRLSHENGLFLWEAFKVLYSPVYQVVKEHLPEIAPVKLALCNYSRKGSGYDEYLRGNIDPVFSPEMQGGCLHDVNCYQLHFIADLFGKPEQISYQSNSGYNGIDTSGIVTLSYPGLQATCIAAMDVSGPNGVLLEGEKGTIRIVGPISSAKEVYIKTDGEERRLLSCPENGNLAMELQEFSRQFHAKDYENCYKMLEHSLLVTELIERCRPSSV